MVADIVEALTGHLGGVVGVPVVGQAPSPRPDSWVLVERTGGVGGVATDFPMVTLEAWAATKAGASELAHVLWDHVVRRMPPVIGGVRVVRRVAVSGPSYQPLPSSGGYRYRMSIQVKHQVVKHQVVKEGP